MLKVGGVVDAWGKYHNRRVLDAGWGRLAEGREQASWIIRHGSNALVGERLGIAVIIALRLVITYETPLGTRTLSSSTRTSPAGLRIRSTPATNTYPIGRLDAPDRSVEMG